MIQMREMAELMHDHIVEELGRKESKPIVEVQIPSLARTSPPTFLFLYEYLSIRNAVYAGPILRALGDERTCSFHRLLIGLAAPIHPRQLNHSYGASPPMPNATEKVK